MNEPQLALRTLIEALVLLVAVIAFVYLVNQIAVLLTGHPLLQIFEDGSAQVLGHSVGCWFERWGCSP